MNTVQGIGRGGGGGHRGGHGGHVAHAHATHHVASHMAPHAMTPHEQAMAPHSQMPPQSSHPQVSRIPPSAVTPMPQHGQHAQVPGPHPGSQHPGAQHPSPGPHPPHGHPFRPRRPHLPRGRTSFRRQVLRNQYGIIEAPYDIFPVVGTFDCNDWLLVISTAPSYFKGTLNADIEGGFPYAEEILNFYYVTSGVSPYFTYQGFLFHVVFTSSYAAIYVCVDDANVFDNPPGHTPPFSVYPAGKGPSYVGTGRLPDDFAFGLVGLGLTFAKSNFLRGSAPLVQGLGQFVAGGGGTAAMAAIAQTDVPPVNEANWVEFYPNDPDNFQINTNLGPPSKSSGDAPNLSAILTQIMSSAPGAAVHWLLVDPNNGAAWTVSTLTGSSLAAKLGLGKGAAALLRSSGSGSSFKVEIALKTNPVPIAQYPQWPSGAVVNGLVDGKSCGSGGPAKWIQVSGPGGNLAAAAGYKVGLTTNQIDKIFEAYNIYNTQPQFLYGIPTGGTSWAMSGFSSVPLPTPSTGPAIDFAVGTNLYRIAWNGPWPSGPPGPSIYMCTNPPTLPISHVSPAAYTSPAPSKFGLPIPIFPGGSPAGLTPAALAAGNSSAIPSALIPPGSPAAVAAEAMAAKTSPAITTSVAPITAPAMGFEIPSLAPGTIPSPVLWGVGIVGVGVLGAVVYLLFAEP